MEHSRLALAHLGERQSWFYKVFQLILRISAKLTYSQLTELLNSHMNRGLPPNLSVNEPSLDFSLKGSDIAAASYLSGGSLC